MTLKIDEKKVLYADLDPTEGIVLNTDTKNYYRLNRTGQVIWQQVAAGKSADEIADRLVTDFEVNRVEALADVKELLAQMKREQLVESPAEAKTYSVTDARKSKKEGL